MDDTVRIAMDEKQASPPKPNTLRLLVCSVCGLPNTDPSWRLVRDEWIHTCPVAKPTDDIEDDPTTPIPGKRGRWKPPRK